MEFKHASTYCGHSALSKLDEVFRIPFLGLFSEDAILNFLGRLYVTKAVIG